MASVADYIVMHDGEFTLDPGETKTFSEHVQNTLVVGLRRIHPILAFRAASTPTGFGGFSIEVNTKTVFKHSQLQPGDMGGMWVVFPGSILNADINNTVQFRAIKKKWFFSDVVLWIQVKV